MPIALRLAFVGDLAAPGPLLGHPVARDVDADHILRFFEILRPQDRYVLPQSDGWRHLCERRCPVEPAAMLRCMRCAGCGSA